jgi:hypothetical protein
MHVEVRFDSVALKPFRSGQCPKDRQRRKGAELSPTRLIHTHAEDFLMGYCTPRASEARKRRNATTIF